MDSDGMAAALYADQRPECAATAQAGTTTQEAMAATLYAQDAPLPENPSVPGHIKDLRKEDASRLMYGPQSTLSSAIPDNLFADHENLSEQQKAMAVVELREIAGDLGLGPADVQTMLARAGAVKTTPRTAEAMREDAVAHLNAAFGQDAKDALITAREFVARDPRVAKMIESMGLGDDGPFIVLIAQQARRARAQGRLK